MHEELGKHGVVVSFVDVSAFAARMDNTTSIYESLPGANQAGGHDGGRSKRKR